ncbi:methylenetetrahydrofolate reductase [Streptomyces sp. ISL-96]|nr:methylenetetrahydrofolate reductase [Streptomyces sp. ISL-96]
MSNSYGHSATSVSGWLPSLKCIRAQRTGDADIRHFVAKCRAGADYAITQMFFHVEEYLRLRDRVVAAGCDTPIIPEIMPATDVRQIRRFVELSGAAFPDDLARHLEAARNNAEGAPSLHYITLNRSTATLDIHRRIQASLTAGTVAPSRNPGPRMSVPRAVPAALPA